MTEKIRLKDETEIDLIPMGIKDIQNLRLFKIVSGMSHDDIINSFTTDNIARVEHELADGSIGTVYEDLVKFKWSAYVPNVKVDDNTVADIYVVAVSTDATERSINNLKNELKVTTDALEVIIGMILGG